MVKRIVEAAFVLGLVWLCLGCNAIVGFGSGLGKDLDHLTAPYVQE